MTVPKVYPSVVRAVPPALREDGAPAGYDAARSAANRWRNFATFGATTALQ